MRVLNRRLRAILALIDTFRRDHSGTYLALIAILMFALIGLVGLGADYGLWTHTQQTMQSAAGSGAGGAAQVSSGAVYLLNSNVEYAGGANNSNGWTQLVADTINFTGNSNFAKSCAGVGTKPLGSVTVAQVEWFACR